MKAKAAIKAIAKHAGVSLYEVSRRLGRSEAWAGMVSGRDGVALETVAAVADACGCDVAIIDRETGERLGVVEPPER